MPLFLYRLESGGIAALLDRCPHRFAALSKGTGARRMIEHLLALESRAP